MNVHIDLTAVTLETERLILRPWRPDDLDDLFAYASVEGVGEAAGWPHHKTRDDSKRILDSFIAEKNIFALEERESGRVIGSLGLHPSWAKTEPEYAKHSQIEIGYVLARDRWGRGFMTEAVRRVLDYCFVTLGLDMVTVGHFTDNDRSRRVIEKCGFKPVKRGTFYSRQLDRTFEDIKYILTREDYLCRTT